MIQILWVEEETGDALASRRAYLQNCNSYILTIIEDCTTAFDTIFNETFATDIIIIDIRIPLGDGNIYTQSITTDKFYQTFGLLLIQRIASEKKELISKVGIYTNERWIDVEQTLRTCNIPQNHFFQKKDLIYDKMFDEFIQNILNHG